MTNLYFNHDNTLDPNTLGRAELVNQIFEAIVAGFDKLPDPDILNQARATYADDTGAANAYVVALATAPASYTAGLTITMKAVNANTAASTVNVNTLGVKAIKRFNGADLLAGDIAAGQLVVMGYDGTNFRIIGAHGGDVELARLWATSTTTVADGLKGSRGYAQDAAASAGAASSSASAASGSASAASGSESSALAHFNSFRGVYYGALASDPATDPLGNPPNTGDWYYNTTSKLVRIYDETDAAWGDIGSANLITYVFTAAGGETSLSGNDDNGIPLVYSPKFLQVFLNGVRLTPDDDYTATNGSTITGLTALTLGDVVTIDAFSAFQLNQLLSSANVWTAPQTMKGTRTTTAAVAALDIDWGATDYHTKSISANSTFTFSSIPSGVAAAIMLRVTSTGNYTIGFPASVRWPDNIPPSLTSTRTHVFMFMTEDGGTTVRGAYLLNYTA